MLPQIIFSMNWVPMKSETGYLGFYQHDKEVCRSLLMIDNTSSQIDHFNNLTLGSILRPIRFSHFQSQPTRKHSYKFVFFVEKLTILGLEFVESMDELSSASIFHDYTSYTIFNTTRSWLCWLFGV